MDDSSRTADDGASGPSGATRRRFLAVSALAGAGTGAALLGAPPEAAAAPVTSAAAGPASRLPTAEPVRPPAVPLAVRSPYLSTWLRGNSLPGTWPTFWTGHITAMAGLALIDGTPYVFMGNPVLPNADPFPTMRQTAFQLTPTASVFTLEQGGVELTVRFTSPVEPGDDMRQSIPLSYIDISARSIDGRGHRVKTYVDISGEWASDDTGNQIRWQQYGGTSGTPVTLSYALATPQPLTESGDMARWGDVVWSATPRSGLTWQIGQDATVRAAFTAGSALANTVDADQPRAISDRWPVFAFAADLGTVWGPVDALIVSVGLLRAPAVSYLTTPLSPLWSRSWSSNADVIAFFHHDHAGAVRRAARLDARIDSAAKRAAGKQYAALCALALRQAYGGTELVVRDGKPWAFLKEISSDGNMSTIDLLYPATPVWAAIDPAYLAKLLAPVLDYAEHGGWPKQFAEHDLGSSYPNANGHNDGNEEDMPVEESANALIMAAAYLGRVDAGTAKAFATTHYAILKQWSDYLVDNALDPGFQNQTDDFTGFIAHSVNLALKGIIGIGAMSQVAVAAGNRPDAARYLAVAKNYIGQWQTKATDSTGDHLKLAYDSDGTWSLKYNGFADRLLGLGLVPRSVARSEAAWYRSRANTYGVPLDIRHTFTKADWELFTAGWLSDIPDVRDLLIEGVYEFATSTGTRQPMTDWYDTTTDLPAGGFQNRPVVGAFFSLLALPKR